MNQATIIDATGKTLNFNTNSTDDPTIHAIGANTTDGVTITANKLVLNANSTKGRIEGINVGGEGQQNKDNPMKLTINRDTEMNVQGGWLHDRSLCGRHCRWDRKSPSMVMSMLRSTVMA